MDELAGRHPQQRRSMRNLKGVSAGLAIHGLFSSVIHGNYSEAFGAVSRTMARRRYPYFSDPRETFERQSFTPKRYVRNSCLLTRRSQTHVAVEMPSGLATITPEGYGFSTSIRRILSFSSSAVDKGYYRARADDNVIDVMRAVNTISTRRAPTVADESLPEVALVFDTEEMDAKLIGIFTERDYVNVSSALVTIMSATLTFIGIQVVEKIMEIAALMIDILYRLHSCPFQLSTARAQSNSEEESAAFLLSPISNYMTPASDLVSVASSETAAEAITAMQSAGIRHLVVADKVSSNNRLLPDSKIEGVISMKDVVAVIQNDESHSLKSITEKFPSLASRDRYIALREDIQTRANEMADNPEVAKRDIIRVGAAVLSATALALFLSHSPWLQDHAKIAMIGFFVLGYVGIIFEEIFEFDKAAIALLMSTGLWITYADYYKTTSGIAPDGVVGQLADQLAQVSDICFFLLAASAIVEVVDAHQGFQVVTSLIKTKSRKGLFWVIGFITFFLSSILNNLTVTIVMVSLLRKLIHNQDDRRLFGAMVVVAANAGGVWTPIGDVTTTMLWINGQLTTFPTVTELFLPSISCLVGSLFFLVKQVEEDAAHENPQVPERSTVAPRGQLVFWAGIASLLAVPVFAELTGLPPYLAMLTGLGAMWALTDVIHMGEEERESFRVPAALTRLDTAGILFFLGILMSIGVLEKSGLLKELAVFLDNSIPSQEIIATVIGLASALIDNVPLVAATIGMYDLKDYGADNQLWQLIALCAGTGGSILVIGSASGVALMGLEKVDFLWYFKKVSFGATVGYFAGIATYLAQSAVLNGGLIDNLPAAVAAGEALQGASNAFT